MTLVLDFVFRIIIRYGVRDLDCVTQLISNLGTVRYLLFSEQPCDGTSELGLMTKNTVNR